MTSTASVSPERSRRGGIRDTLYQETRALIDRIDALCLAVRYCGTGTCATGTRHRNSRDLLQIKPDFSLATIDATIRLKHPADRAHLLEGLRKAGLEG